MEIAFNKTGNVWVAEFEATGNFAIHIERAKAGIITMEQTSVQGSQYAPVADFPMSHRNHFVIDEVFTGEVFPLYIKVVSETEPTMAVVTFKA